MRNVSSAEKKPRPRICIAIDEACEESGLTNREIGALMSTGEYNIGRWRRSTEPTRDDLVKLEKALKPKRRPGWISKIAGYFEEMTADDLVSLIEETHLIGDGYKKLVIGVVADAIQGTAEERAEQEEWRRTASANRASRRNWRNS